MYAKVRYLKLGMFAAFSALVFTGLLTTMPQGVRASDHQDSGGGDDQERAEIRIGLRIAPVPLNLYRKNIALVGLGSYIVNAQADCNGCHTNSPQTEFTDTGNPYLLPPVFNSVKQVNPATYLGGGQDLGALAPGSAHIISRNLTPDKTGLPAGGHTYEEFVQIIRHGTDFDHLHPTCPGTPDESCVPFPFNGDVLQIMPWPTYQSMTDHDLRAIYEYLKAIPCIAGPPTGPLHNDCGQ